MTAYFLRLQTPEGTFTFPLECSTAKEIAALEDFRTSAKYAASCDLETESTALDRLGEVITEKYPNGGVNVSVRETLPGVFEGSLVLSRGSSVTPLCRIAEEPSRLEGIRALTRAARKLVP